MLEDALFGQTFVVRLVIRLQSKDGFKTQLSSVVRLERRTTEDSSSTRIMRLAPVFTLKTNNACLPKFVQTDDASSRKRRPISGHILSWSQLLEVWLALANGQGVSKPIRLYIKHDVYGKRQTANGKMKFSFCQYSEKHDSIKFLSLPVNQIYQVTSRYIQ